MYEQHKKEFTKYLRPDGALLLILAGIYMIVFSAVVIYTDIPRVLLLFWIAVGLLVLVLGLCVLKDYPAYIRSLEQSGYMPQILQDYVQAESALYGHLRFGKYYLYVKGYGKLLSYQDITCVYPYSYKRSRTLRFVNREGREMILCKLKTNGKDSEELKVAIGMLYRKNPSLQVGRPK